jgi:hypothetical protein
MLSVQNIFAQSNIQWYKTTAFASQTYNYYTSSWNNWSEWEKSDMNIKFDLTNDVIVIYSPNVQVYTIFNTGATFTDTSGGKQVKFNAYDGEGDRADIRLRIEKNGNSQIYVDYADMRWVYNVRRFE